MSVHYDLPKRIEADLALMAEKYNKEKLLNMWYTHFAIILQNEYYFC